MIKIYCKESDEPHFTRYICYDTSTCDKCREYENECDQCSYFNHNIQFIHHDLDRIIIETNEIDLDVKTCLYNTFYNFRGCGVVDLDKDEDCRDCRFWYENIELINYKEETK